MYSKHTKYETKYYTCNHSTINDLTRKLQDWNFFTKQVTYSNKRIWKLNLRYIKTHNKIIVLKNVDCLEIKEPGSNWLGNEKHNAEQNVFSHTNEKIYDEWFQKEFSILIRRLIFIHFL